MFKVMNLILNIIKLGYKHKYYAVFIPKSKKNKIFLNILLQIGYIDKVEKYDKRLKIYLRYKFSLPIYSTVVIISKPSRPVYYSYKTLKKLVKYDLGTVYIISNSFGLCTHLQSIKLKQGGLVLCKLGG